MITRALILAGGLAGGAAVAQFPEFSQQYVQRLGGAVDALEEVVADFDASAEAVGLSRGEALAQMTGSEFVERRRADMTRTIGRFERLSADLAALEAASPFARAGQALRFSDRDLVHDTWAAFRPAMPVTTDGLAFAGIGVFGGMAVVWTVLAALKLPFRRRPGRAVPARA